MLNCLTYACSLLKCWPWPFIFFACVLYVSNYGKMSILQISRFQIYLSLSKFGEFTTSCQRDVNCMIWCLYFLSGQLSAIEGPTMKSNRSICGLETLCFGYVVSVHVIEETTPPPPFPGLLWFGKSLEKWVEDKVGCE